MFVTGFFTRWRQIVELKPAGKTAPFIWHTRLAAGIAHVGFNVLVANHIIARGGKVTAYGCPHISDIFIPVIPSLRNGSPVGCRLAASLFRRSIIWFIPHFRPIELPLWIRGSQPVCVAVYAVKIDSLIAREGIVPHISCRPEGIWNIRQEVDRHLNLVDKATLMVNDNKMALYKGLCGVVGCLQFQRHMSVVDTDKGQAGQLPFHRAHPSRCLHYRFSRQEFDNRPQLPSRSNIVNAPDIR